MALTAGSLILIADRRYWGKPDIEPTSPNGYVLLVFSAGCRHKLPVGPVTR
jgi:hypothetical protein